MSVPLTASLYVPGTLDDADKVLADIGTGYFVEKTMDEGRNYCERKINLVKSNFDLFNEKLDPAATSDSAQHKLFMVPPLFPRRLAKCKNERKEINPRDDPKSNKRVSVGEDVSAVLQKKILPKCKDQETMVIIQLADRLVMYPEGVLEDVLVKAIGRPSAMTNVSNVNIIEPLTKLHFEYHEENELQTVFCSLDINAMEKLEELLTIKETICEVLICMEAPQFPRSLGKNYNGTKDFIITLKQPMAS
ncbi:hypothetical protein Gotri_023054 [Gossypium trilobum]|uniref:Uncharacterized protein n=1 Tax=Gossypium trilobum TaxID=34281 RepID=A0A7J9DI13_9ROSI|nr:hypothetical protein [Gossypium trilobum]